MSSEEARPLLKQHAQSPEGLATVVKELCDATVHLSRRADRVPCAEPLPSRDVVIQIVESLRSVLFPGYFGVREVSPATLGYHVGHLLDQVQRTLQVQIKRGLAFGCQGSDCSMTHHVCEEKAQRVTATFLERLPLIQRQVASDVRAAYEGDPAATSPDETIFCYPGVLAVTNFRIAHELHRLEVPLLPRMITEHAHSVTGIDIHPGATIGDSFFIDHGTGVVVGETCVIGRGVRIYQGVTLGAKSFPLDADGNPIKGVPRHPIIEDEVIIYSGATILGRITIGAGSVVGGNVWLTRSVPPNSRITILPPRQEAYEAGGGI